MGNESFNSLRNVRQHSMATDYWQPYFFFLQKEGFIFIFIHWILILHVNLIKYKHYYIYEMYYNCY